MIEFTTEEMAAAMGAEIVDRGSGGVPKRAEIDSRKVTGGELFFGLTGGQSDGGLHAAGAISSGAWGVVVSPERAGDLAGSGVFVFASEDPLFSLQTLARAWRRKLEATVIGITGSVGKTSVKDITRALLPGEVHASAENFNTEIGLPLTILESPAGTETLVLEMAMRGAGQIAELAAIAEPDIGVITNVGPVHVELLGSIEAVAAAKAELIEGMKSDGVMIVPFEAGHLEPHLEGLPGLIRFGGDGEVRVLELEVLAGATKARIETLQGEQVFEFPFAEPHNLLNAQAAIGAGVAAGFTPAEMASRADGIAFSRFRNEHLDLGDRGLIINDCYNANPVSMRAALEYLAQIDRPRKLAVLGLMAELGPDEVRFHEEIGSLARELEIEVIGVGDLARSYDPDLKAGNPEEAARLLGERLGPETVALVKGSRAAGLERVTELVAAGEGSAA
ncbi:MAG: UDP-N-acetylmuramoyl-tripeptide--D-alanyl-D-alanine ligase [Solirubrobacterales bacterium]|nr:UDP-N-acetylmuramoyl-tripeptide--D-alanyl-D-alanine ligase [Solirubrobacterales bacterium]